MTNNGIAKQPTVIVTGSNRGRGAAVAADVHGADWRVIGAEVGSEETDPAATIEHHQQETSNA